MRKKSGFGLLTYLVGSFSGSHNVSYLITPLESKVAMIVYYVLQDKEKKIVNVMDSTFGVDNLLASAFTNASGKVVKLLPEILQDREEGITFILFDCMINPTQ